MSSLLLIIPCLHAYLLQKSIIEHRVLISNIVEIPMIVIASFNYLVRRKYVFIFFYKNTCHNRPIRIKYSNDLCPIFASGAFLFELLPFFMFVLSHAACLLLLFISFHLITALKNRLLSRMPVKKQKKKTYPIRLGFVPCTANLNPDLYSGNLLYILLLLL